MNHYLKNTQNSSWHLINAIYTLTVIIVTNTLIQAAVISAIASYLAYLLSPCLAKIQFHHGSQNDIFRKSTLLKCTLYTKNQFKAYISVNFGKLCTYVTMVTVKIQNISIMPNCSLVSLFNQSFFPIPSLRQSLI